MKMLLIAILSLALLSFGACTQAMPGTTEPATPLGTDNGRMQKGCVDVTPQEAQDLIDNNPDLIIIDVSPHYAEGHLPGAVGYYLGDGSLDKAIPTLDKSGKYLVYCHVDSVAIQGAQKLVDAGFSTVYRLEGNYSGWVDAGYPVEK
jgi:rhodanese-related sulfurtransferase